MYRLLRRISSSITDRLEKGWNNDTAPNVPQVGSKRQRDDDDDEMDGGTSESATGTHEIIGSVTKRSRLVYDVPSVPEEQELPPSPSPTPSPRQGTPEAISAKEGDEVRQVTTGVKEVDLEDDAGTPILGENESVGGEGERKAESEAEITPITDGVVSDEGSEKAPQSSSTIDASTEANNELDSPLAAKESANLSEDDKDLSAPPPLPTSIETILPSSSPRPAKDLNIEAVNLPSEEIKELESTSLTRDIAPPIEVK